MDASVLLTVDRVSKSFGSTQALKSVSLIMDRGSVLGLAGENGAGKSTLVKILCGVHSADSGRIEFDGHPHHPKDPEAAEMAGISVFHQEIPICTHLSIAANVFLGPSMPRHGILPDWPEMNRRCVELYRTLLGEDIDPTRLIDDCTTAEKQLALLVRVLSRKARLVILDEPTTALTPPEVARLFSIIVRLKEQGISFIFISHMLEELMELSDAISVFRDGENVGALKKGEFEKSAISRLIAGRTIVAAADRGKRKGTEVCLEAKNLCVDKEFKDISFKLEKGEILGIAGLQGSGRSALVRSLFGTPGVDSGELFLNGVRTRINSPLAAIGAGIGFVPEDRQSLGLFGQMDVKMNLCMAGIERFSNHGILDRTRLLAVSKEMGEGLSIKTQNFDAPIRSLSGGNQQKVLISRWLALRQNILLMIEPTRGVDVGAKQEITELIINLTTQGYSFIVSSIELDELIQMSDRILVMNRGRLAQEFTKDEATKEKLILAATT